jgi:hypothetical protein
MSQEQLIRREAAAAAAVRARFDAFFAPPRPKLRLVVNNG